jgi:hypothetical protein
MMKTKQINELATDNVAVTQAEVDAFMATHKQGDEIPARIYAEYLTRLKAWSEAGNVVLAQIKSDLGLI